MMIPMKTLKYTTLATFIVYAVFMFINPIIVAWSALVVVAMNTVALFITDYYNTKKLRKQYERNLANTLANVSRIKNL